MPTPVTLVLAAHGPTHTTREALQRADALVGRDRVLVYPGTRAGLDAVRALDRPGTEVVGSAGLDGLVAELPPGPVLHLHDDVLLTAPALRRLHRTWQRSGGAVVPRSNDPETDHFEGPLPLVVDARPTLSRARGLARNEPATRVRPSCVLLDRDLLLGLRSLHPSYPLTTIELAADQGTVAAGAVAAHDGACAHRVPGPDLLGDRPLLVAALIVRDEEDVLADCLASLDGLVDRVVVCDTGSVDDTVAIARAAGAEVIERAWRDDFGWARNEVLDAVGPAHFVLSIDADETVEADVPLVRRLLALAVDEHDVLTVRTDSEETGVEAATSSSWLWRIFRPERARWSGALHEQLVPAGSDRLTRGELTGITLHHRGYTAERVAAKGKADRNVAIARRAHEEAPTLDTTLNYARSLAMDDREPALRRRLLEEAAAAAGSAPVPLRSMIAHRLADRLLADGEVTAAIARAREAAALVPGDTTATLVLARALAAAGDLDAAWECIVQGEHARREGAGPRPVVDDASSGLQLTALRARLAARRGATDEAVAAVAAHLDAAPSVSTDWTEVVAHVVAAWPEQATDLLAQLAIADASGSILSAVANGVAPGRAAEVAARALEQGGRSPGQLEFALVAVMVSQRWDLFERLLPHRALLEAATLHAIADRLEERGEPARAAELRAVRVPASA